MNPLARSNAHSNHSRGVALHRHNSDMPGASTSLKSFIARQGGPVDAKCYQRVDECSEAAVIAPPASSIVDVRGPVQANTWDAVRRVPARTRSLRRGSSARLDLHTRSHHGGPSSKPHVNEAMALAKESLLPARKRISITAKDFADLIAAPTSDATPSEAPVKLTYDLSRTAYDSSAAVGALPPSNNRLTRPQEQPQPISYRAKHDQVATRLSPSVHSAPAANLPENHEQVTQRSKSYSLHKQKAGSGPFRRSSSEFGIAEKDREHQDVRRTVSLDNIKVMDVPVLRRRSSVRDGQRIPSDSLAYKGSGHSRPPRQAALSLYDHRPSYKEAQSSIPTGSDRSSLRSESFSSSKEDLPTLEFLQSFSEFSELTDEWEPNSVRRAKSFDGPPIQSMDDDLRRSSRSLSDDLTSPTEMSSGLFSDGSRQHPHPPRQIGTQCNRGSSPGATPSSSRSTDPSAPHAVSSRNVTPRKSSSRPIIRGVTKSDSRLPSA